MEERDQELLDDEEEGEQERLTQGNGLEVDNREQVVEGDNGSEQVVEGVSALVISPITLRRRRTRVMVQWCSSRSQIVLMSSWRRSLMLSGLWLQMIVRVRMVITVIFACCSCVK